MTSNACLYIDLSALRENALQIQREIGPRAGLIPVLKADAYGLGAVPVAKALADLPGIDTFAVSQVAEGLALREAGFRQEILVMSLPLPFQLAAAAEADLTLTLGGFHQFAALREVSTALGRPVSISLKLDSGLHRIGFEPSEADALIRALREHAAYLRIKGAFSHFSGDDPSLLSAQEARFRAFLDALRASGIDPGCCHLSASAALEAGAGLDYDAVRVGRRLFLDHPAHPTGKIREVCSLRGWLTDVRERRAGEPVGYGAGFIPEKNTRIGILSLGYGDGLDPALARANAPVLIRGQRASLLSCCMDQSFVDLGDLPAAPGDEVTLFGYDGAGGFLSAQEVAAPAGWEGCDLTSRLTPRVKRCHIS